MSGAADPATAVADSDLSLLELADRMLNRGVVLVGEATISVAGVDLIYLGLNLVLTAVETLEQRRHNGSLTSGTASRLSDAPGSESRLGSGS